MKALTKTDFHFDGQKSVYHGKVRDVYDINDDILVMVATDRISAFDVVLPKGIPFKGQVLNQIAAKFLDTTTDICPNWKLATPDPMVTVGLKCEGFRVEMIIRSILTGSAWREYQKGCREICGVKLPEGMRENEKFPQPIITPTTKAEYGEHDADIRDHAEQRQQEDHDEIGALKQQIRAKQLALVAHRLRLRDLDRLGGPDIVARHEDIGYEAVFICADGGEHESDDRNEEPQKDPEIHPCHAAQHTPDAILAERGEQVGRFRLQPRTVAVEVDHAHRGFQQQRRTEPDSRDADEADMHRHEQNA